MKFLTPEVFTRSLGEVGGTLLFLFIAIVILEAATYFLWGPFGSLSRAIDRGLKSLGNPARHLISSLLLLGVVVFVVGSVGVGQMKSPLAPYWPLAVLAFIVALFMSPNASSIFRPSLRLTYMLLLPAIIGILLLIIFPLLWEVNVSFTNFSTKNFKPPRLQYVGLRNYVDVFTKPVLKQVTFLPVFMRTVLWTVINVVFHVGGGLGLALLLNRPMKLRGLYRTLLVFPWAVPQVIACLAWRGEFHFEYGFVNIMLTKLGQLLPWLGIGAVAWKTNPTANFAAMCITNIWLGIPFMMVIILGGLQSIAGDYYEAAELDGASPVQQFRNVTLPLLKPVLTPAIILGTIWTFNNFNVPFFINENELETSDTLVTALFRSAFQYFNLADAAAFAFVLFGILLVFSVFYVRQTGAMKGVYD
jgi:arabinogalactan oligomer/maltooligosaccharide transport system permease protein